ncbi:cytochrome P450 4C1-like [Planococcus citri]|uniref:cytochrome P450 4C1-like n=1 Tax=Planococcus citri TaxID=170843 RepID=UPI0031FA3F20
MFSSVFVFNVTTFLCTLPIIILVILWRYIIKTYRRDPRLVQFAETIPGPPEVSIFGSSADLLHGEDSLNKLIKYTEKYGHMYKLWFGRYLVVGLSKAEDINAVFMSSKTNGKPDLFFNSFHDYWGDGLFTSKGSIWKNNRKKLTPPFAGSRFKHYAIHINDKTKNVLKVLEKHVNGPEFDIKDYTPYLSFDIITKILFNVELSWDNQMVKTFHHSTMKAIIASYERMCLPWFHMKFLNYFYYGKEIKEIYDSTRALTKKIWKEKTSQINNEVRLHKENPDKLPVEEIPPKLFLTEAFELLNDGYDETVVHDEMMTAISGGTDTTATVLAFLILSIALHQNVQAKLYDEIYEVFGDNDRYADQEDIKRLSYLDQVVKESMRRFTLVPFILKDVSEDAKIGGRVFPAGTVILIPIAAVHFDPKYYPNPWQFNPENFSSEAVENRPKHTFIPFSAGARNCIGQNLALYEMKLITIALLRKYSIHTTMKMKDIKINSSFTISSANGYNISIKYRIKKPSYLLNN